MKGSHYGVILAVLAAVIGFVIWSRRAQARALTGSSTPLDVDADLALKQTRIVARPTQPLPSLASSPPAPKKKKGFFSRVVSTAKHAAERGAKLGLKVGAAQLTGGLSAGLS